MYEAPFSERTSYRLCQKKTENSEPVKDLSSLEGDIFSFQDPEWPIRKWWQWAGCQRCLLQWWWAASKCLCFLGTHRPRGRCLQLFSPIHSIVLPLLQVKQDNPNVQKSASSHAIESNVPLQSWRRVYSKTISLKNVLVLEQCVSTMFYFPENILTSFCVLL